ncbi:hypothetical protein NDN08_002172 [Rhodosorus marinus]|uniref:NTF2 domain-containing protein n=1 Tax=Rhodosorus marinus TaxID=101924 RepID=A0AAV8UYR5_9RHOD|nr:hypothetical protein NDN08_002172 [Rhodosorus marinus]
MVDDDSPTGDRKYEAEYVAKQFVILYYKILSNRPNDLYRFYKSESVSSFADGPEDESIVLQGEVEIQKQPKRELQACNFEFSAIDSQWSLGESLVLQVYGKAFKKSSPSLGRNFVNSFLLYPQANGWFVRNDVFRFTDEKPDAAPVDGSEVSGPATQVQETATGIPAEHVSGQVSDRTDVAGQVPAEISNAEPPAAASEQHAPVMGQVAVSAEAIEQRDAQAVQEQDSTERVTEDLSACTEVGDPTVAHVEDQAAESTPLKDLISPEKISYASIVSSINHSKPANGVPSVPVEQPRDSLDSVKKASRASSGQKAQGEPESPALPGIYVSQMPNSRTVKAAELSAILRDEFSQYGHVENVDLRLSRGYAFVDFDSETSVMKALESWKDAAPAGCSEILKKVRVQVRRPPPKGAATRSTENSANAANASRASGRGRSSSGRGKYDSAGERRDDNRKSRRDGKREHVNGHRQVHAQTTVEHTKGG